MINIFIYFNMMLLLFFIMFIFSMVMYYMNMSFLFEWMIISYNSINVEFLILLDWISMLFMSFIILISSMIILYSFGYMDEEKFIKRFNYLILLFIFSMLIMVVSPNILSIMFGWDGLGLVSYCLVIFYQNFLSYNSGMVTILLNRIGDIGMLMSISLMMFKGSWNIWMMESSMFLVVLMMMVGGITKSAQIPFSIWLPMAMAAPTPVSALVHSSTLVTAGVYLMIRFNKFLMDSGLNKMLFLISILTMFMSGLMANIENDLKKIIALSTLSQLGLMMMILSLGMKMLAFFHLLVHAIFKSMLFMCAGIIIHSMVKMQDIRNFGNLNELMPFCMMSFFISNMALIGFPFISGFYSKDYIMELIYSLKLNMYMLVLIMLSLMLTVMYLFRIFYYLFFMDSKFISFNMMIEMKVYNLSMFTLVFLSIIIGSSLQWMFFFNYYMIYLDMNVKMMTLMLCLFGLLISLMIMMSYFNKFSIIYFIYFYMNFMWFLSYIYMWIYTPALYMSNKINKNDKIWVEFMMKNLFYSYVYMGNIFKLKDVTFMTYMIYMYLLMFISFILVSWIIL